MAKFNMDDYSDREIVDAFLKLLAAKFVRVLNAVSAVSIKMQRRGEMIAKELADEEIDDIIRRLGDDHGKENERE